MQKFSNKINNLLDSIDGDFLAKEDARYKLRVIERDIDTLIEEYRKAIVVTQSAFNNSTTQKELHSNAIVGYKQQLDALVKIKEDVAAALAAILPSN